MVVKDAQLSLTTLKSWKTAYVFLVDALKQTQSELPHWLWRYEYPTDIDKYEKELIRTIQFVLTDFSSKCNRQKSMINLSNSERTFWVDRVVPLFQIFGDQTGLLNYQWCEVFSRKHAENTMNIKNCTSGKARFVDGMGYDIYNEERVVMESSSGAIKENIRHTVDDTVKQVHSTITILNSDIRHHMNAISHTMTKTSAFGIHLVRTTMTLSATRLNNDCKSYSHEQIQSCEIRTSYEQRTKWLRTFDLMAKLMELLRNQTAVSDLLKVEQDGAVKINENDTIRAMLQRE